MKTKEDSKSEKEEKILQYVKEYYADGHNKGKTIPRRYKVKIANTDIEFNLGQEISYIKQFLKGAWQHVYSQELIEELKKIDSAVLKGKDDPIL